MQSDMYTQTAILVYIMIVIPFQSLCNNNEATTRFGHQYVTILIIATPYSQVGIQVYIQNKCRGVKDNKFSTCSF